MKKTTIRILSVILAVITLFSTTALFAGAADQQVLTSAKNTSLASLRSSFRTGSSGIVNYKFYEPAGSQSGHTYPLVVFIHGLGHGWTNNSQLNDSYMPLMSTQEMQSKFNEGGAYILLPQMPEYTIDATMVNAVWKAIDNFANTHNVDKTKIYLMGSSAGGGTSWRLLINHKEYFKAAVITCATHVPSASEIKQIGNVPVWMVSAKTDPLVWYFFQKAAWRNLKSNSHSDRCRFTTFSGAVYFPDGKKAGITHYMAKAITYNFELIDPASYNGKAYFDGFSYPGTSTVDMSGRTIPTIGIIEWLQGQDRNEPKLPEVLDVSAENANTQYSADPVTEESVTEYNCDTVVEAEEEPVIETEEDTIIEEETVVEAEAEAVIEAAEETVVECPEEIQETVM